MTWKQLTERDRREWRLSAIDPHVRDTWRSGVRSAMHAASQLPGRRPTVVDIWPLYLHVNQKSDDDDAGGFPNSTIRRDPRYENHIVFSEL